MERNSAAGFFPKKLAKVQRRRAEVLNAPLNSDQIASLLAMRFNREPLYASIEDFYTQEYQDALRSGAAPAELSKVERYRRPTQKEAHLLFCDIHAKEQLYVVSGSNAED